MARNIAKLLPESYDLFLRRVGVAGAEVGLGVYLVGGVVRDLLLGETSSEIDLLVEGDGHEFATQIMAGWEKLLPGYLAPEKVLHFPKYLTSKILFEKEVLPGILELDVASTRAERYAKPGGAPEVWSSSLVDDLARRDFSVNAVAMRLSEEAFGEVVDLHHGLEDARRRQLRILHDASFSDDPARMLRGVRFLSRLGFCWEKNTQALFEEAREACCLQTLPKGRLFDEFRKALDEPNAITVLKGLSEHGLLDSIIPGGDYVTADFDMLNQLGRLRAELSGEGSLQNWRLVFALFNGNKSEEEFGEILCYFEFGKKLQKNLLKIHKFVQGL